MQTTTMGPGRLAARALVLVLAVGLVPAGNAATGRQRDGAVAGSSGVGDAYFPLDGNGGYQVRHYTLDLRYTPSTGRLRGTAELTARARSDLTRFDLDFLQRPSSVTVDGRRAAFRKDGRHELVIRPRHRLAAGQEFVVVVRYAGRPDRIQTHGYTPWNRSGERAFVNGEPHHAAVWFPVDDHPSDKATYDVRVTVPRRYGGRRGTTGRPRDHRAILRVALEGRPARWPATWPSSASGTTASSAARHTGCPTPTRSPPGCPDGRRGSPARH